MLCDVDTNEMRKVFFFYFYLTFLFQAQCKLSDLQHAPNNIVFGDSRKPLFCFKLSLVALNKPQSLN